MLLLISVLECPGNKEHNKMIEVKKTLNNFVFKTPLGLVIEKNDKRFQNVPYCVCGRCQKVMLLIQLFVA